MMDSKAKPPVLTPIDGPLEKIGLIQTSGAMGEGVYYKSETNSRFFASETPCDQQMTEKRI